LNLDQTQTTSPIFESPVEAAFMDAFVEGMVIMDEDGRIEHFNKSALQMFGYSPEETIGQDISILMPEPDRSRHAGYVSRYLATRKAKIIGIGREMKAQHRDGTVFPMHLAVGEVTWRDQRRFIGLIRNLTDDKRAEERRLRQHTDMITASRLTTMGEMAAAMAHEINQPLAAIANYASAATRLLDTGPDGIEDVRAALGRINEQSHRAGAIISKLRSFVKPEAASLQVTSVNAIVDDIQALAELDARANNMSLTIDVANKLPEIVADGLQIQQVVLNLLRNGIDAMRDCEPDERRIELHSYVSAPDEIRIDVIDRGHGMSKSVQDNVFNPFFTTKSGGMGMGLAISQTIVKSHGGKLGFENNPSGGTTFFVTLPTKVA